MRLHELSNENGVKVVNFITSKKSVKSIMLPHHNNHKYTWTSPNGRTHNLTDILINKKNVQIKLMSNLLEELTEIMIIIWWLNK
jgi:hypothetical protein